MDQLIWVEHSRIGDKKGSRKKSHLLRHTLLIFLWLMDPSSGWRRRMTNGLETVQYRSLESFRGVDHLCNIYVLEGMSPNTSKLLHDVHFHETFDVL